MHGRICSQVRKGEVIGNGLDMHEKRPKKDSNNNVGTNALLEMGSYMTEKPFYIDSESGEKVYYDNIIIVNGQEIVVEPATQEEVKKWLDFILSVDKRVNNAADNLLKIVNEEAAFYFNDQKPVEDVAKIIQARMSIYVGENN